MKTPGQKEVQPTNHEVEIRALLRPDQRQDILQRLQELGAQQEGVENLIDMYLCPEGTKSFSEIEMDRVGSYSLRLRKKDKGKGPKIELNTKTITQHGDHNAWDEHEVELDSFEEAVAIFKTLGFKSFFTLEKTRYNFSLGNLSIAVEDIKNFGPVLEVEVLTSQDKAEEAKTNIRSFFSTFGVTDEQIVPKSVTNMMMRQQAQF